MWSQTKSATKTTTAKYRRSSNKISSLYLSDRILLISQSWMEGLLKVGFRCSKANGQLLMISALKIMESNILIIFLLERSSTNRCTTKQCLMWLEVMSLSMWMKAFLHIQFWENIRNNYSIRIRRYNQRYTMNRYYRYQKSPCQRDREYQYDDGYIQI